MLGREKYAKVLTAIVENYAEGFVLAINNEWGTGKTTFVKMWQQQLNNKGFQTLYFNAWENDFEPNPLIALISEIKTLIIPGLELQYKSLLKKGAVITKSVLPHILRSIAEKYMGKDAVSELIEDTTAGATQILEDEMKDYASKKEGLKEFRNSLSEFVEATEGKKPIIFIIDELDRCRPNYAVELLEQIKHLFSVSGIGFVLSIDKTQLGHAIKGVYGNDRINADEYLRRFIDLEYSIPDPDTKTFCNYLYNYFEFEQFFTRNRRESYHVFIDEKENLLKIALILFENVRASLRQQEKTFAHARLGLKSFSEKQYVYPELYFVLVFVKIFHSNYYYEIRLKKLKYDQLLEGLAKIITNKIDEYDLNYFIYIEALLLYLYSNFVSRGGINLIITDKETNRKNSVFKSQFDKSENHLDFIRFIESIHSHHTGNSLEYILNRIDLIQEPIP